MACGCGCCGAVSGSRMYRRRRAMGAAADVAATAVQTFNLGQYIPPEIESDYATGKSYYDTFSKAAGGVSVINGHVELTPAAQQAAADGIVAGITAVAPYLGAAYAAIMALGPHAGAGPGECVTNPPSGPLLSQLQAWPNFHPWASFFQPYAVGAPNSFEAFANPVLEYNWLLSANCFSDKALPPVSLLATLIASWNATHAGPQRQICRSGLNPPSWGLGPGYDPIAQALEAGLTLTCPPNAPQTAFGSSVACGPFNVTSCFAVNNGPIIVKPLTLHFPSPAVAAKAPSPGAPAATSAGAVATVAVLSLAAAVGFYVSRHPKSLARLRRKFRRR